MALRVEGISEEMVNNIRQNWREVCTQPRAYQMLRFAEQVTRDATQAAQKDIEALREVGFSDADILDIVHVTCLYNYLDRLADALGVPLDEALAGKASSSEADAPKRDGQVPLSPQEVSLMITILIVENDPHQRLWLEEELTDEGYCVLTTASGREALTLVKNKPPDLIVLDINPKLPVVIHTAFAAYHESFMSWAADAYVVKSSDISELKRAIAAALRCGSGK